MENIYPVHESYLSTISSETQFRKHIENTKFYDFDDDKKKTFISCMNCMNQQRHKNILCDLFDSGEIRII